MPIPSVLVPFVHCAIASHTNTYGPAKSVHGLPCRTITAHCKVRSHAIFESPLSCSSTVERLGWIPFHFFIVCFTHIAASYSFVRFFFFVFLFVNRSVSSTIYLYRIVCCMLYNSHLCMCSACFQESRVPECPSESILR